MKKLLLAALLAVGLFAQDMSLRKCTGCHGVDFEKVALGKSKVVADMNVSDIVIALNGYKDGTYGGPMKGLMKSQVMTYSDEQIEQIAAQISKVDEEVK